MNLLMLRVMISLILIVWFVVLNWVGFKNSNLFESLFIQPSELQHALARPPESRSQQNLECIVAYLAAVPLLKNLLPEEIRDLARVIEYRPLGTGLVIFRQDAPVHGLGIVLKGTVQVSMQIPENISAGDVQGPATINLRTLDIFSSFGHLDLLFAKHLEMQYDSVAASDAPIAHHEQGVSLVGGSRSAPESQRGAFYLDAEALKMLPSYSHAAHVCHDSESKAHSQAEYDNGGGAGAGAMRAHDPLDDRAEIYCSYVTASPCELLFVKHYDWDRILRRVAMEDLTARLETLRACRVFSGFSNRMLIRLARMGEVNHFMAGKMLLDQGDVSSRLYVIMKGMCKSFKKPNKLDILLRKLNDLEHQALEHDTKYRYHHKLRNTLTKAKGTIPFDRGTGLHTTIAEESRYVLELEINKLKSLIRKTEANMADVATGAMAILEEGENDMCEISTLQWPMIFGEVCVTDPMGRYSPGRIICDTNCLIFSIHYLQLQTFRIDAELVDRLKKFSVAYPSDAVLVHKIEKERVWSRFKTDMIESAEKQTIQREPMTF